MVNLTTFLYDIVLMTVTYFTISTCRRFFTKWLIKGFAGTGKSVARRVCVCASSVFALENVGTKRTKSSRTCLQFDAMIFLNVAKTKTFGRVLCNSASLLVAHSTRTSAPTTRAQHRALFPPSAVTCSTEVVLFE